MREERFEVKLECELDENDLAVRADELADKIVERDRLNAEITAFEKPRREKIKTLEESISALAKEIDGGTTTRAVECIERPNDEIDQVEIVRLDTQAVVRTRAYESDERQLSLGLGSRDEDEMPEPLADSDAAWEESAKPNTPA